MRGVVAILAVFLAACRPEAPAPEDPPVDVPDDTDAPADTDDSDPPDVPPAPEVELTDAPRERLDPLVCRVRDGGDEDWTFSWTVDGAPWSGLALTTDRPADTVFPGYTRAGQTWTCTASAGERVGEATTEIGPVDLLDLDPLLEPLVFVEEGRIRYEGPLADQESVTVRYGFDGWAERFKPEGATVVVSTPENDNYWGFDAPMQRDGNGWSAPIDVPAFARVVHLVFDASGNPDDNGGLEYTWDFVFPSVGPFLGWNDVVRPDRGIVVSWETGLPGLGVVEYGPDEENVAYAVGAETGTLHHVPIGGLPPDTSFVYRVRDASGRTSPWASFATAAPDADRYVFLVASDMQDGGRPDERWVAVAEEMYGSWPDARFVLTPGDLAANDIPGRWWLFFDGGRRLFANVPIVPAVGNHDTPDIASNPDTSSFQRWFGLDSPHYRVEYGRTRIFSVSTEEREDLAEGAEQDAWIEAEAAAMWDGPDRTVDWAFAQFHHPAYDAGARFAAEAGIYRPITARFDGNVDVVFQGHEHIYQRFLPLAYDGVIAPSGAYGLGPDDGVAYLVTPAAGFHWQDRWLVSSDRPGAEQRAALAYPLLPADERVVAVEHGYLVADVAPDRLVVRCVGLGTTEAPEPASVLDELVIER
jgi:hypothetical protein